MAEQQLMPVNMSHEDLLRLLDHIRACVAAGDSFEGSLQYLMPEDQFAAARSFDVQASYRVGNLMGQGGMVMVGEWREVPREPGGDACGARNPGGEACWFPPDHTNDKHSWEVPDHG
jgi:hypothetical protein